VEGIRSFADVAGDCEVVMTMAAFVVFQTCSNSRQRFYRFWSLRYSECNQFFPYRIRNANLLPAVKVNVNAMVRLTQLEEKGYTLIYQ
jgi:hypothetical protein